MTQLAVDPWIPVGPLSSIPLRGARTVDTPRGRIAVFRTADDQVFALADRCPHQGGPLSQGIVSGEKVYCPLHDWCIGLREGRALDPDEGEVARYPVRVVNGQIFLTLEAA